MDPAEAERIFTITKSPIRLLKDQNAIKAIQEYIGNRELGDSKFLPKLEIYGKCEKLLQEQTQALTKEEFQDLRRLGIGARERKQLNDSLNGDRPVSNRIIQEIQEICINEIALMEELKEFSDYIFSKANKQ